MLDTPPQGGPAHSAVLFFIAQPKAPRPIVVSTSTPKARDNTDKMRALLSDIDSSSHRMYYIPAYLVVAKWAANVEGYSRAYYTSGLPSVPFV